MTLQIQVQILRTIHRLGAVLILITLVQIPLNNALMESDRLEEYKRRGYQWPPRDEDYTPNTKGWKKNHQRRFQLFPNISNSNDRYNAYMIGVHTALNCQNFTQNGWGLTKAPKYIIDKLKNNLNKYVDRLDDLPTEKGVKGVMSFSHEPNFIRQLDLNQEILDDLLPLHEAWAGGIELIPNNAYGLRLYRNQTSLYMHVDKTSTHIISSILHVDHDPNSEPWPLVIEDLQGNTNEVFLESGDLLFYESSKLLHGRPRTFSGTWYTSLFSHYYPADWDADEVDLNNHYRVPPEWADNPDPKATDSDLNDERLVMAHTTIRQPSCIDNWCALNDTVKVYGPAPEYGKVLTANGVIYSLTDIPSEQDYYMDIDETYEGQYQDYYVDNTEL